MTGERGPAEDLANDWAENWATIWASEAAALAADREVAEAWHRAAALSEALRDAVRREAGPARPDAPAGATPAGAAPGLGELDALRRRVAELERCLAERDPGRRA